ncbi:hypothetical protein E2C01_077531 [Portunus trituberculatus]|uniref:Uncharacterized protein n=1 Tax=Portunus trituberculatus TaxID=210409 RepID=A0A5B7IRJ5_PORTR|nr:hypothetical protein [Portunus trituberculatus]
MKLRWFQLTEFMGHGGGSAWRSGAVRDVLFGVIFRVSKIGCACSEGRKIMKDSEG